MSDGVFESHKLLNSPRFVRSLTYAVVAVPIDFVIVLSVERGGAGERVHNIIKIVTIIDNVYALRGPNSDILVEGFSVLEGFGEGRDGGGVPAAPSAKL